MRYNDDAGEECLLRADAGLAGCRLDVALVRLRPELSRAFIQRLLADGLVDVAGRAAKASLKLRGGEDISVFVPEPAAMSADPEDIPLAVLYEDADVIVIDKPPGLVVHPSPGHERGTLVNALAFHCRDLSGIGGVLRPGIVHRLDRDTSGCLAAAKHDAAHQSLTAQFAGRSVEKTYLALTDGAPRPSAGKVEGRIGKDPRDRRRMAMLASGGRPSLTFYRVVESFGGVALVECGLKTGRTHQIRVHLRHVHAPVLCDALYGRARPFTDADARAAVDAWLGRRAATGPAAKAASGADDVDDDARKPPRDPEIPGRDSCRADGPARGAAGDEALLRRQGLHAWKLAFTHPSDGRRMAFEAPLPPDMAAVLAALRARRDRKKAAPSPEPPVGHAVWDRPFPKRSEAIQTAPIGLHFVASGPLRP